MKNFSLIFLFLFFSFNAMSQTVTVNLPKKYSTEDIVKVDVDDGGNIWVIYKIGKYENKKALCGTLSRIGNYGIYPKKTDPLYNLCLAAEESVIRAIKK